MGCGKKGSLEETAEVGAGRGRGHALGPDLGLHADTTDTAAQGPTVPDLAPDLTAGLHHHDDTLPLLYCPTSSPSPVTTTATRRAAPDTTTAAPVTRGSARGPALVLPSKWTVNGTGRETGTESASTLPKNTSTSAAAATENVGTGTDLARTRGRGSAATRANTTAAAAATQDTAAIDADTDFTQI